VHLDQLWVAALDGAGPYPDGVLVWGSAEADVDCPSGPSDRLTGDEFSHTVFPDDPGKDGDRWVGGVGVSVQQLLGREGPRGPEG